MKNLRNIKHIFAIILISLFLLFGAFFVFGRDFFVPINYFLIYRSGKVDADGKNYKLIEDRRDIWQDMIYKPKLAPSDKIAVIAIDEKTLNYYNAKNGVHGEYSMLGIPKSDYAKVTDKLTEFGVKAIGFDIIFQNKDPDEDDFIKSLITHGNSVIAVERINSNFVGCTSDIDNAEIITCPNTPRSSYKAVKWWHVNMWGNSQTNNNVRAERRTLAYDIGTQITQNIGGQAGSYSTGILDQYRAKFGKNSEISRKDAIIYTLPLAMMENEDNPSVRKLIQKAQDSVLHPSSGKADPIALQPYFYTDRTLDDQNPYLTISFIDLIEHSDDYSEILKWKYVLFGEKWTYVNDTFANPVNTKVTAGVYSHAFFLDGILQNKMLEKLSEIWGFIIPILVTIASVTLYFFLPKFVSPVIAVFSIILVIFLARYSYGNWRVLVDIFPILLASSIITYPATYIYKFFVVEKDKRVIMNAFSRYLSPSVVSMIDENKIEATLGGEKKELSILFSDIAGFTSISEKMDTKELFTLMTKYLSKMTDILVDQKWTLDKYIGDAVMGFYGAPVDDPEHAKNACHTAIRMRHALADFNAMLEENGIDKIDFRVGIATGEVMVGNIGSERQFNYTVLGDTVNLASRLEGTGKEYGVNVIISAGTRAAIGDEFLVRELDYIAVKWKSEWSRIFELIDTRESGVDMTKYMTYESALELYRRGNYMDAGRIWESLAPTDKPSEIMMRRCVALIKGEMQLENGVYIMTHK